MPKIIYQENKKNIIICRKQILLGSFFLLALTLLFFCEPIINGKTVSPVGNIYEQPFYKPYAPIDFKGYPNYLLFDQSNQFLPMQKYAMSSLKEGKLPLWNPNIMLGTSILGSTQTALFYPINLLSTVLSPYKVILIRCILNLWLAGFFMLLLMRQLGANLFSGLVSSISFMFSGFLIVWLGHPHSNSAIWLPIMILMAEKILYSNNNKILYVSLCGLFISFSFLGGHMETTFSITFAWFCYFIIRSFHYGGGKLVINNILNSIIIVLIGIFAAAIQIIPFIEWIFNYAGLSERSSMSFVFFNFDFWKDFSTLPSLILPNLFSNPAQSIPYQSYLPWTNFNEFSMYVGIIPLIFGIFGLIINKDKTIRLFILGSVFFLALSIKFPFFDYVNQLPILNMFKSTRYRLIFDFGIAVAAGLTLDRMISDSLNTDLWKKIIKTFLYLGSSILILIIITSVTLPLFEERILALGNRLVTQQYSTIQVHSRSLNEVLLVVNKVWSGILLHFSLLNWKLFFPAIVAILVGIIIFIWQRKKLNNLFFKIILLILIITDLFVFGIGYNPSITSDEIYPNTPAVNFIKKDKSLFRILPTTMQWRSNGPLAHDLNEIGGCELPTKYYHDFRNALAQDYPFSTNEYSTGFMANTSNSKLINLLNVKYILTSKEMDTSVRKSIKLIWRENDLRIYENTDNMNRAFLVNNVRFISDDSTLSTLKDSSFNPDKEVLLPLSARNKAKLENGVDLKSNIIIESYEPEKIKILSKNSINQILVLSDAYYPGWHAYIDGIEVSIYRANYVMRAIFLPKGEHKIVFKYEPYSFYIGFVLSLITIIFIIIISIWSYIKNKKYNSITQ
jgi:hypothetical protein